MQFKSPRLILKEFQENDFHLLYSVMSDENIMKYAFLCQVSCEEELKPYFEEILKNNSTVDSRKAYEFAVYSSQDLNFIGVADIIMNYQNSIATSAEIGYFLLAPFWGKGFATEIANTLLEICFLNLKLHRVVASCNVRNKQSEKVMKKIGMIKEGEFREARYKNGQWDNELRYGILAKEWRKNNIFMS
ncbi:MAG: GNAT family N-acetyltransferase [Clostridia bacterium]|nr:GNAT family N-acetyltransferase [Clostridia bacterium]